VTTFSKMLSALAILIAAPLAMAQGTYTQIDVPGAAATYAYGISGAGDVVGYYYDFSNNVHGFLLSGGTYTTIDYPGTNFTPLYGINDLDQIVGKTYIAGEYIGFLYNTPTRTFTTISYPGATTTIAVGINDAGTIVGEIAFGNSEEHGFELVGFNYRIILPPGARGSFVGGIDYSNRVAGFSFTKNSSPFFYSHGKYKYFTIPGIPYPSVLGINPAGTALVGVYTSGSLTQGFLYQDNTVQIVAPPGATFTNASGISNAGEVVGYFSDASFNTHGFTWTPPAPVEKK
jgi:probable HAF family extracellular repeat protein